MKIGKMFGLQSEYIGVLLDVLRWQARLFCVLVGLLWQGYGQRREERWEELLGSFCDELTGAWTEVVAERMKSYVRINSKVISDRSSD